MDSVADDKAGESNTIRIGEQQTQNRTFVAGIYNESVGPDALPVLIDSTGKLGTMRLSGTTYTGSTDEISAVRVAIGKLKASNDKLAANNASLEAETKTLKATVAEQAKAFAQQQAEIKNLTAGLKEEASLLEKVSLQIQLTKPAPQVAANN